MSLNSGGKMTTDKFFFQKIFRRGGKWQRGENDRGYYGNYKNDRIIIIMIFFYLKNKNSIRIMRNINHKIHWLLYK